jgi:hypothetical protein
LQEKPVFWENWFKLAQYMGIFPKLLETWQSGDLLAQKEMWRIKCIRVMPLLTHCFVLVLDLVSQVRDVILMNVYLDLGNSGGRDFGMGGKWARGGKWEDQFTSNLDTRWTDPITARRVPSK